MNNKRSELNHEDGDLARSLSAKLVQLANEEGLSATARQLVATSGALLQRLGDPPEQQGPLQPIRLQPTDERLKANGGTRGDGVLRLRGPSQGRGHVLHGPYVPLPAGDYRFELALVVEDSGNGPVTVTLCHKQGNWELYGRPCLPWELDAGRIQIALTLEQSVDDFEFRLEASTGFRASVSLLSISARPIGVRPEPT